MTPVRLGLRHNLPQFALLVMVNAFVGAMAGMERSILPLLAEQEFQVAARAGMLSFIVVFGVAKALSNYVAGRQADRLGRKRLLVAGWLAAIPVPFLLMGAPSWTWVLVANLLLGVSQGLTWSMTVIMKIDLVGQARRGTAMGINEFAGYLAVGASALATGWMAARFGLRPEPFYLGVFFAGAGLVLSVFLVRETRGHVELESGLRSARASPGEGLGRIAFRNPDLASVTQAGFVNNMNDGMAWGLFPLLFAGAGVGLAGIGVLAAVYPVTWGVGQLFTGAWSDRVGRKRPIVLGMWIQAAGIGIVALAATPLGLATGCVLLGLGTALVYPTLLAAVADLAPPAGRASAVGVYRLWRDLGYAAGALIAGFAADLFGLRFAVGLVAALTFISGLQVRMRLSETGPSLRTAGDRREREGGSHRVQGHGSS